MHSLLDSPVAFIAIAFVLVYGMATIIIGTLLSGSIAAVAFVLAGIAAIAAALGAGMFQVLDDGPAS